MPRSIPATMATQHPDNARAPYWESDGDGFVSTQEEVAECYSAFHDLNCQEFLWDWEGKHVDEAVVEKLLHTYYPYFHRTQLGRDKFLTFRIPNIWHERGYSLARAFMGMLTAERMARDLGLHAPPLFEVILPLVDRAEHIIHIQRLFTRLARFTQRLFHEPGELTYINIMPLLERVEDLLAPQPLLERYLRLHVHTYGCKPDYLRPHIARSDPALNAGLVPAVLAGKLALSEYYRFGRRHRIPVHPAVGVGLLPFRGGLSPQRVGEFLTEYAGIRTVYIQSAFRYDFPLPQVKRAIAQLNRELPHTTPPAYTPREAREIHQVCHTLTPLYRRTVERIAGTVNQLATSVPARRERKQHVGLFGYSRSIGRKHLPRAIPFTAALYSLGVPPEFIGTGRGLKALAHTGIDVTQYYINLRRNLNWAGRYLNKDNLAALAKHSVAWREVWNDVTYIEAYLGTTLGPQTKGEFAHQKITTKFYRAWRQGKPLGRHMLASGVLRHSLG